MDLYPLALFRRIKEKLELTEKRANYVVHSMLCEVTEFSAHQRPC
jgi:hypothetical protein